MPSSYTLSLRVTLQATGENNNTWGAILNSGVFGLLDYAIAGGLAFSLSGTKTLTTANGDVDEARAAFLDIQGGSGGTILLPPVSKGYFIRNAASGQVVISAGATSSGVFEEGDSGPVFTDGVTVYGVTIGTKTIRQFVTDADQVIIDYINLAISSGSLTLPPPLGQLGKALMVRNLGSPPAEAWTPSLIQQADVQGLVAALAALTANDAAQAQNAVIARALYGDIV